ncbi:uncharacterized protein LOC118384325 isoform X2 [Oncorhynchus keta]|uniref:uncharacterized protein LOC118384325 isoform X2 n=1 Tax=Oncorhynchus keta TaxID=8018 RepID=UPI00227AAC2F|nr:uncharacterized protein LOC118384325 isoform X2 [Oncorhynchus keta]
MYPFVHIKVEEEGGGGSLNYKSAVVYKSESNVKRHACTTSRADTKRGNPNGYQGNMTSDLAWIIRACLFVCLWRACLCKANDCMHNELLTEMVERLPKGYLFRVNKSEERFVAKALSRFYGENCKKDFECKDYTEDKTNSTVCYLLTCLHGKEPECVSDVTYSLADVELVSLKSFKCLVEDAFNQKYNLSQEQEDECADVFVDAVRCQKATTLDTKTPTIYTTTLPTINYKTSSIPPKTSSSTTPPPPSSLTSSTISNSNMESQEQQLQSGLQSSCINILRMINGNRMYRSSNTSLIAKGKVISVSTLLAISLIANILLLGVVILRTRGRRQHEGVSLAMPELTVFNGVEVNHLMQNDNGDALQH